MKDYNQIIDEILAGLSNYIVESIHLQPTPVEMKKLNQKQAKQAILQLITEAKIEELNQFVEQLNNNHYDEPIGTARQYVRQQQMLRLSQLKEDK